MKLINCKPKIHFFWKHSLFIPSFILVLGALNVQTLDIDRVCPRMLQKVFNGYAPIGKLFDCILRGIRLNFNIIFYYISLIGNKTAGTYKEFLKASVIDTCAIQCCMQKDECNVAFVFNEKCFHVKCNSDDACMPLERTNMETKLKMVLVNPVNSGNETHGGVVIYNLLTKYQFHI